MRGAVPSTIEEDPPNHSICSRIEFTHPTGTKLVLIASNGGADRPPDWLLNLQQHPRALVEIGTDKLTVTSRTASAAERERLWIGITATHSGYAEYQERTTREIPVLLLTPEKKSGAHS